MADNLYNINSIESLPPREFTRLKPNVYCGSTADTSQLLIEIVSNSIDEVTLGHGLKIEITSGNGKTSVRDYGQGFIVNYLREDGKTILEASFSVLNTSGKYRQDGTYGGTALGNFGIGSKLQNYLSTKSIVTTYRDGEFETDIFKDGLFESRKVGKTIEPNGTYVEWYPDKQFFDSVDIDEKKIVPYLKTLTCLIPGLEIIYNGVSYISKNGLNDLADAAVKDNEIIGNRLNINEEDGKNKIDLIMTYTSNYSSTIVPYINTGLTDSGPHITQLKTTLTREFNKFAKEKKWLKTGDDNLSGENIQEGLYLAFNITAPNVKYDAQVKSRVEAIDMKPFTQMFAESLQMWFNYNEKDIKIIVDKALLARKAAEAARKAREKAREVNSKPKKKLLNLPSKLVDANSKNRADCELFIVEGDSAAGGMIEARTPDTQAVFPIRGKIINIYKNSDEKVFANQEINNLIKALGLDFDAKTKKLIYDVKKLRYGRIFTATDADPDGAAIKNLLITDIWSLCPELILNGHMWVTIPPLFRITKGKDTYIYLRDNKELEEYKSQHQGEKYLVNRNKGLGEQDADELGPCILDTETRNVAQITVEDVKKAEILLDILMGTSVPPRRAWLLEHAEEASDNLW